MYAFISLNQGLFNSIKINQKKTGVSSLCAQLAPSQPFLNSKQKEYDSKNVKVEKLKTHYMKNQNDFKSKKYSQLKL